MDEPKKTRGRPKDPWAPFGEELLRRLKTGEACPTVEQEAKYLAEWAKSHKISTLQHEQIRNRINKRYGGSVGYKNSREWHLAKLPPKNSD